MTVKIEKRVVAVEVAIESDVAVLDGTDAEALIVRFNAAKAALKDLEAEKKAVEADLRALLGDAKIGTIGGVDRLVISEITRENIDREVLREHFIEAYEAARTETTYTVLKTK
jgi:predicted phage-related endonuclease